jgi:hypothetical protein
VGTADLHHERPTRSPPPSGSNTLFGHTRPVIDKGVATGATKAADGGTAGYVNVRVRLRETTIMTNTLLEIAEDSSRRQGPGPSAFRRRIANNPG